jgi:hypothetical protein
MEHWRRRCHECFLEDHDRHVKRSGWDQRQYAWLWNAWLRDDTRPAVLRWINEGNPCHDDSIEPPEGENNAARRIVTPDETCEIVSKTVPANLADDQEPYGGGPFPFSVRNAHSLGDCYFVLAIIHDEERRDSNRINPFFLEDRLEANTAYETNFWDAQSTHVSTLTIRDQMTLDDCMARVESDLGQLATPLTDETPPKSKPVKVPRHFKKAFSLWQTYKAKMQEQKRRPELRKFAEWARTRLSKPIDLSQFKRFLETYRKALRRRRKRADS